MEATGAVLRRVPIVSGVHHSGGGPERRVRVSVRPPGRFSDEGHVRYYVSPARCGGGGGGGKSKEEKKRAKLAKALSKDLTAFYSMGDLKEKRISEAAELLLAELNQLRTEAKEEKRKRKEAKAAAKAARMKDDDASSSSSSESSDSVCDTVVKMSRTRPNSTTEAKPISQEVAARPMTLKLETGDGVEELAVDSTKLAVEPECGSSGCCKSVDKIEVCMGGKCKRSGALQLMEEFEKRVGVEGAVVGCKCMGKCRDGPNVRVVNQSVREGEMVAVARNPLCIGVGLEDVGSIVASFFGENKDMGLMAV